MLFVSIHHAVSSTKLLPRPLSPVSRFTRGSKSKDSLDAGPTLYMASCCSIAVPYFTTTVVVAMPSLPNTSVTRAATRYRPACS